MRRWFKRQPDPFVFHLPDGPVYLNDDSYLTIDFGGAQLTLRVDGSRKVTGWYGEFDVAADSEQRVRVKYGLTAP